jgi:hypothetical protein
MIIQVLVFVLLLCLGLLLGSSWTLQAIQPKLRRQAEERRRLNDEWSAVRAIRYQLDYCPHCGTPLPKQHWGPVSSYW